VVPAAVRFQVHRTQLPALGRIFDTRQEAFVLFLFRYFEPILEQDDALAYQKSLERWAVPEKFSVLFLATKVHYVLNTGAVVPAPVEDDNFASGGQLFDVALSMELRFLPVGRCGERDDTKDARADALHDAFDDAAFAGSIPSLENDDNAGVRRLNPLL